MPKPIRIVDTTLRDGMHSVAHQFTPEQMAIIAAAMDPVETTSATLSPATKTLLDGRSLRPVD